MSAIGPDAPGAEHAANELEKTVRAQTTAADPAASAWVSANAGTGKTHVLTRRVLRLLLAGTAPERILCLTFTKAAATEMANRVLGELSQWVTSKPDALDKALTSLLVKPPTPVELARARQLFALAIETPGGLKVQTIHAFCERLLQRFPLEAGIPAGFTTLDEVEAQALRRAAIDRTLVRATSQPGSALADALAVIVRSAADQRFETLIGDMLAEQAWLESATRLGPGTDDDDLSGADEILRSALGVSGGDNLDETIRALDELLAEPVAGDIAAHLAQGTANDQKAADRLRAVRLARSPETRLAALADAVLTTAGEPRKSLMTKGTAAARPDLAQAFEAAQADFLALHQRYLVLRTLEATLALMRMASAVAGSYAQAKEARAALDFGDLIGKASNLLSRREDSEWVLYKLDGGIDHILVDEAQDTSPEQWKLIEALTRELISGRGAREDVERTIFAVGDEKQSIYSFQGAAPHMLAEVGRRFATDARAAGKVWQDVPLTLSFRTVPAVLEAVDLVFGDAARTPGVSFRGTTITHQAARRGHGGLVEIWETEVPDAAGDKPAFDPLDDRATASPVSRLARRIGAQIAHWLDSGETLASTGLPIAAGNILILVRRRQPFGAPMVAELKQRGIPVAGADRMRLSEQIAVADLVALGDAMLLPEDDLSLAALLKSPLIGLDDDDLLRFAPARQGALWTALLRAAEAGDHRLADAGNTIKRWRRLADFRPPYEFYAGILDTEGGRRRLLARLGPEAGDAIDAFLDLALGDDESEPPSLQGFLGRLRDSERQVKRDMDQARDEVRIMTVHGAKGLEAPIVILADTCSVGSGGTPGGLVRIGDAPRPAGMPPPVVWPVAGAGAIPAIDAGRGESRALELEERYRLLYVAMTRAGDRLYVAGFEGRRPPQPASWYATIRERLDGRLTAATSFDGRQVWRMEAPQCAPLGSPKARHGSTVAPRAPPGWASLPPPRERDLVIPLAPSRMAPLDIDESGDPIAAPADPLIDPSPPRLSRSLRDGIGDRFLRGTLTHALLQHLPDIPPDRWEEAASAFVSARGQALPAGARSGIVGETLAILREPLFAPVFGRRSRAEVALVALVEGSGPTPATLRIAGQVDRLLVDDHEVLLVDYKTNRPPPRALSDVPETYLLQLAGYRLALGRIYPGHVIRAALLWTDGPRLMAIPSEPLDTATATLWKLARRS